MALLVVLHQATQLIVDRLDHLVAALLPQGVREHRGKGSLLGLGRHGSRSVEQGIDQGLMDVLHVFGIVQGVIEIGAAVVKGREQEAHLGLGYHPVGRQVVELVFLYRVAESRLGLLDGADAAQDVGVDFCGAILQFLPVLSFVRHIVGIVDQEDQIVGLQLHCSNDLLEKFLHCLLVLELRIAQGHEQLVLCPAYHLLGLKGDVQQVLAQGPRQSLFQQAQDLLILLLGHDSKRLVKLRDDLPVLIHIAPTYVGNAAPVLPEAPAELRHFFFVHRVSFPWYPGRSAGHLLSRGAHYTTKPLSRDVEFVCPLLFPKIGVQYI